LPSLAQPVLLSGAAQPARHSATFVAPTAALAGRIEMAEDAGIYFACVVDAGDARIALGARTNVQDNSFLITDKRRGDLLIGDDVTIGHNVRMGSGTVGDRARRRHERDRRRSCGRRARGVHRRRGARRSRHSRADRLDLCRPSGATLS
jgi:hypothetical protein